MLAADFIEVRLTTAKEDTDLGGGDEPLVFWQRRERRSVEKVLRELAFVVTERGIGIEDD